MADSSKLTGLEDNMFYVSKVAGYIIGRLENIVINGEIVGYRHSLFSHSAFKAAFYLLSHQLFTKRQIFRLVEN